MVTLCVIIYKSGYSIVLMLYLPTITCLFLVRLTLRSWGCDSSSEALASLRITRGYNPQVRDLHGDRCDNLGSNDKIFSPTSIQISTGFLPIDPNDILIFQLFEWRSRSYHQLGS
jgi:hypothetical protein